jgi:hypothetical protein
MILNVDDDRAFASPTVAQLQSELADLETDAFLILSRADEEYLQTYREEDGSFEVEYRDGSCDRHYRAESADLELQVLQGLFVAYFHGKSEWKASLTWEKVDFDEDFQGDEDLAELPTAR